MNEHDKKLLLSGMTSNTGGLGAHGNNDNVMPKVLDTANLENTANLEKKTIVTKATSLVITVHPCCNVR